MNKAEALRQEAHRYLTEIYGPGAQFREGQYEAIEATITKKRVLVVQRTGWGKSLIYFICTKLMRSHHSGSTMVISPLLVLMDNQMEIAGKMGLRCAALNSSVKDPAERARIMQQMKDNLLDMLFITPETLLKEEVRDRLKEFRIGLFVVDEAHCISDWGNDFRLEYGKLGKIISRQFSNVRVLATTATANDRVVDDLKKQLGNNVYVSRGPLTRESLHIQVLPFQRKTDRYAWLIDNVPKLPGTGIIYCLDHRDCDNLSSFLNENGISAMSYYSERGRETQNEEAINAFQHNRMKAIVATIKLGMGYDKGDVSFVIHFQSPSSIVTWYQQIGRAGRSLKDAYIFLMTGREDDAINEYFIRTAFPTEPEMLKVLEIIRNADGLMKKEILSKTNIRPARVDKVLSFLENEEAIYQDYVRGRWRYYASLNNYVFRGGHYREVSACRYAEMNEMKELIGTKECLSRYAVNCLGDHEARNCGRCANCTGKDIFPGLAIKGSSKEKALNFIANRLLTISPRKQFPDGKTIPVSMQLQPGWCLSKYMDGYGELVARGKYPENGGPKRFDDLLVKKSAEILNVKAEEHGIRHITCVPSLRSDLVKDFTQRLARYTGLTFVDLLIKSPSDQQKKMQNSYYQYKNVDESFSVKNLKVPEKLILVDDVVDSRWTLTVCGIKLIQQGCKEIYPFALADSSHVEE